MQSQCLQIDGAVQLALRVYESPVPSRTGVVIGGAMGVWQDFYAPFATWPASLA